MVTDAEERVAEATKDGAATGVPAQPGTANTGVAGAAQGMTPVQPPRPEEPQVVPIQDFKNLQRALNQQNDALRRSLQERDRTLQEREAQMRALAEEQEKLSQELLQLKTAGLPDEEAERERLKYERDALKKQHEAAMQRQETEKAQLNQEIQVHREAIARQQVMRLFIEGGTTVRGQKIEGHAKYGLTPADLLECPDPQSMEMVAARKREEHFAKREAELERKRAEIEAQGRKDAGVHTVDSGEPTGGGTPIPRPGTPEFREYTRKVAAGEIKLRRT